ncbi:MAG: hypothetical protein RI935_138 [Candidatus Parcubacteria bacterium]|jgi:endonuclease/exonuclease/phosphatase family metal-dependent hydrolase
MKIISFNIGNFIWAQHLPGRKHYAFHKDDIDAVCALIKQEDAQVVFLQEVETADIEFIKSHFPEFPHFLTIHIKEEKAASLFMSMYPITDIPHSESHDYIINGITFFPIHLYAFSPKVRREQVLRLLPDLPGEKGVILGDTNFWIVYGNFLSRRDKRSYNKIIKDHVDVLKKLGPTCRIFLSLDKIFITKDLISKDAKITKHTIGHIDHYMISTIVETT